MHLSYEDIDVQKWVGNYRPARYRFCFYDEDGEEIEEPDIDSKFFYSVPTSFFALNSSIPKILRKLFIEAKGCLKSNYLTGASVCVRKIIYELAIIEGATGVNYDERVKSLKLKRADIEPDYFDTLLTIQQITSDKVHENSYDGWDSSHLQVLLSTLSEILDLMYVIPSIRAKKRTKLLELKKQILGKEHDPSEEVEAIKTTD